MAKTVVPRKTGVPLKPLHSAFLKPEVLACLERCSDNGYSMIQTQNAIEAETGIKLHSRSVLPAILACRANRIDNLRKTVPEFANNLERTEFYITELAAIGNQYAISDPLLYLKFQQEDRQWILLQEKIRTEQLTSTHSHQSVTINVEADSEAKSKLVDRVASLIAKHSADRNTCESESQGSGVNPKLLGVPGSTETVTT